MLDDAGWDALAARTLQPLHAGAVGNHDADLGAQLATSGGVDDRLQVGAGAEISTPSFDRRALCHRCLAPFAANRVGLEQHSSALAAATLRPGRQDKRRTQAAQMSDHGVGLARRHDRDHAEAVVEGAIHLSLADSSMRAMRSKIGGTGQTAALHDRFDPGRQHARQILDNPPPVMFARRDRKALEQRKRAPWVDFRRGGEERRRCQFSAGE